jgi:hypothetical protein
MKPIRVLMIIAGIIAVIAIGIYAGNQALIQNEINQASKIESLRNTQNEIRQQLNNATSRIPTDLNSIQRAFQRCFIDFDSSSSAKTCINYLRFKDCINTAMGRFK